MEFHIERQTDVPLILEGTKLADQSSRENGALRWQEIRIYRVDASDKYGYVTEVVGETTVQDERVYRTVTKCETADDVRQALFRVRQGRRYLNDLALEALYEAAESDQDIAEITAGERM